MAMFVFLCIATLFLQLGFLVIFWFTKSLIDLISFALCISTILLPVATETFGKNEHLSKMIMSFFLLLIILLSAHQLFDYWKKRELVVLVRSVNLFVVASLYMILFFYAEFLNTA